MVKITFKLHVQIYLLFFLDNKIIINPIIGVKNIQSKKLHIYPILRFPPNNRAVNADNGINNAKYNIYVYLKFNTVKHI